MSGPLRWILATGGALVVVRLLRLATRDLLALPVLQRPNLRGTAVPTAAGALLVLAVVVVHAVRAPAGGATLLVLGATLGFGFLGLVDDLLGDGSSRGFRGHIGAAARGRLTTGGVKLLGGGAVALVLASAVTPAGGWRVLVDLVVVALAANLANLFDRAPGRLLKVWVVAWVPLAVVAGSGPVGLALAPVAGGALGLLPDDLGERLMLGDTGANALGAALGIGLVLEGSPGARVAAAGVLLALNLAAEVVSFSRVIDTTAPLRALDRLGRRP